MPGLRSRPVHLGGLDDSSSVSLWIRPFQGSPIPPSQGGTDLIGTLKEVQNHLVGGSGPTNGVVGQNELAHLWMEEGRIGPDRSRPAARRLRECIGEEGCFLHLAVTWPESGQGLLLARTQSHPACRPVPLRCRPS